MASMVEIGNAAWAAGLRNPVKIQQAIAIAMAESGGNPNAVGDVALQNATWGPSIGLWQIRSVKAEEGKGTVRDASRLKDPAFNAKAMVSISRSGADWGPWTTWPLRAAPFLPVAAAAASAVVAGKGAGAAVSTAEDVASAPADAAHAVVGALDTPVKIANWLTEPGTWTRISFFALGGGMILAGLVLFVRPVVSASVDKAVATVGGANKVVGAAGTAAKIARKVK